MTIIPPEGAIVLLVIYDNPEDYPGLFAVREWYLCAEAPKFPIPGNVWTASTLEGARALIPPGFSRVNEKIGDMECVVEVYRAVSN